ncbi:Uu.00g013150.m01.CDS01 [Anthostomella pinea]|uniref:Uu.00g013150.m01.CDS01 n=1 Tax=Anthostomella pinea TaxID=933095 RepID=A0AAI8VSB3_9PEZI|nr:Uu.00g013150.m01.CDS01 [Anthostomella pinea]
MSGIKGARNDRWAPPPDPDRPNCPYVPGFQTGIETHRPPTLFGGRLYGRGERPDPSGEWLSNATQSEHVLAYPPLETSSPIQPATANLTVIKTISIGNARGAQLVACRVAPQDGKPPYSAVAKIYDALYYPFSDYIIRAPIDVVDMADEDYSREAAAYEHLKTRGSTGSFAPAYFGSWTLRMPITKDGKTIQRPVRLILMEHLDGPSMRDMYARNASGPNATLDGFHLEEEYRLEVLARLMDGLSRQLHMGVAQRDVAPRNVVVVPPPAARPSTKPVPRVVLVDYNKSIVYERTKFGQRACQKMELPPNPMERYWDESLPDLAGWIPHEWYRTSRLRQEWLTNRFGGEKRSLYAPIKKTLEFTDEADELNPTTKNVSTYVVADAAGPTARAISPHRKRTRPVVLKEVAPPPVMMPGDRYSTWPIQVIPPHLMQNQHPEFDD